MLFKSLEEAAQTARKEAIAWEEKVKQVQNFLFFFFLFSKK